MTNLIFQKIILASKSPRRSQLLRDAGFVFEVRTMDVDEDFPQEMPVTEVATFLAKKKADAFADHIGPDEIVLTADSTVVLGDRIFNKPEDFAHAVEMLRALSGAVHTVYTGVCLKSREKERLFTGMSQVHFAQLTDVEIDYYVRHYKPFDKAGSYAIQEWIGLCKISKIEGSYSNIMGLPMELVYHELINW